MQNLMQVLVPVLFNQQGAHLHQSTNSNSLGFISTYQQALVHT